MAPLARPQLGAVLRHVRQLAASHDTKERTDRQLLHDFVARRSEAAFTALVRRYGPLVLRVCRQVLHHAQDAEDAFQAAFLVLARQAASIRQGEALASWLHQVAFHVASKARRSAARRRGHESRVQPMTPRTAAHEPSWHEVQEVLHEEIQRLPEKLRAPFVLCVLEGKSRPEAARQLGWKEGTVSSRLARARQRLQRQLTRRGLTLSAVLAAAALAENASQASLPAALLGTTVQAALRVGSGQALAGAAGSTRIAALAAGALRALAAPRLRPLAALLLAIGLTAAGVATLGHEPRAAQPAAAPTGAPAAPAQAAQPPGQPPVRRDLFGDPLPAGAIARMGTVRFRHAQVGVAFAPNGKWLASAGYDGTARVWDVATGRELRRFVVHQASVQSVQFAPDGKALFGHGADGRVYIWDLEQGKLVRQIGLQFEAIPCWALAPDGKTLATAHHDFANRNHKIRLWDAATGKELRVLKGHDDTICSLTFSPDGTELASAAKDDTLRLWATATGTEKARHKLPTQLTPGWQFPLVFSPDGKALACGGMGKVIHLLEAASGKELRRLEGPGPVTSLAFYGGGKRLAAAHLSHVLLWEVSTGKELRKLERAGRVVAVSPDGKLVASGSTMGVIQLWDAATGEEVRPTGGHRGWVWSAALAPDGTALATGCSDGTLRLWDAATGKELRRLQGGGNVVAFTPDGTALVAGGPDKVVHLWERATGKELRRFVGHTAEVMAVAFAPDGRTLATGGADATIRVWNSATGEELRRWQAHGRQVLHLRFSPDGKALASGGVFDSDVVLWDPATGRELKRLKGHANMVRNLAFAPDGRALASSGRADTIHLWDVATGKLLRQFDRPATRNGRTRDVFQLAFSPDGRTLVSGEEDGAVRLWEVGTGALRRELTGHGDSVHAVTAAADGRRLASAGADTTALVWELTGQPPANLEAAWEALGGTDAAAAYQAVLDLAAAGRPAVTFLAKHLKPVPAVEPVQFAQLLADLDSNAFVTRDRARAELQKAAELAEPALRKALEQKPSLELQRRVERLLVQVAGQQVRIGRALEVLERIGGPEAQTLLETLARGSPGAWRTGEAARTLERLQRGHARQP
jgi:RNA polymerase sigma factor (sigma-70 family)